MKIEAFGVTGSEFDDPKYDSGIYPGFEPDESRVNGSSYDMEETVQAVGARLVQRGVAPSLDLVPEGARITAFGTGSVHWAIFRATVNTRRTQR